MPKNKSIADKDIKFILPLVIFLLMFVALGGFFYFHKNAKNNETKKEGLDISYFSAKGENVDTYQEISGQNLLIYAEKEVMEVNSLGENKYQTNFFLTGEKGEKKFKFYSAEDLTYETAYPYLAGSIIIVTEFGQAENRAVGVDGEKKDFFLPPVAFGTDFILSSDKNIIAYLENKTVSQTDDISGFNYLLKIKDLDEGDVLEFDPTSIKHQENSFDLYLPVSFSDDNSLVYIFAQDQVSDDYVLNPGGLYALNLENMTSSEIYYSSIEENEDKDIIVLLGFYPAQGFALVNRGPQVVKEGETILRTQLQKLDLKTGQFQDIFINEKTDQVGYGGRIISPDGNKIILLNDAYYDQGLILYDIKSKEKVKLSDQGEFKAWWPDSQTIIYQTYEVTEGQNKEIIRLHALNTESREDYILYTQDTMSEGTGLNQAGDVFYEYIGVM
ncbi:MAG: hypothetical protein ABIH38_02820 [Patescibacteria group bacterium]